MGGGFAGFDLKNTGQRLSVIHCRCSYGVPMSQAVVGVRWGSPVGTGGVKRERARFSYP